MKKTEHYQLNQWELSDRIMMEDFNADNEKIEAALKQMETLVAEGVKLEAGQYHGTGSSGVNYPNTLAFSFEPQIVFVINAANGFFACFLRGAPISLNRFENTTNAQLHTTWSGNTLSWYSTGGSLYQLNTEHDFIYVAIG